MRLIPIVMLSALAFAAEAAQFQVEVEVPRLRVAEYHAPYVAFWIETPKNTVAAPLGLWYDDQEKWLKDLRQWWRRTGRSQSAPYDGLTGATRSPGKHSVDFSELPAMAELPAGDYQLVVEAAREVGGREVVRIPFQWPPASAQQLRAEGTEELHDVTLTLTP
ncbi:hypothetical protein A3Q32_13470 [Alcanivorax sp. KX64203]|nr:hypothetical protein A3Q32_13470 [Alcanivorax sp. KX64203]